MVVHPWTQRLRIAFSSFRTWVVRGHTYLHHIVENYGKALADVTYFLQGDPLAHANASQMFDTPSTPVSWFQSLGRWKLTVVDFKCVHWDTKGQELMRSMYTDLFESPPPDSYTFTAGAIFAASRKAIEHRPLAFWKRCLDYLAHERDPFAGYAMERMWDLCFDPSLKHNSMQVGRVP